MQFFLITSAGADCIKCTFDNKNLANFKFKDHAKSISEFFNVSKSFKTNSEEIKILENFNFKINKGDRIGILGGNGSGKTTFLKLLLKEKIPDRGTIKNYP